MITRPLTSRIRPGAPPPDLADYVKSGGYQAVHEALGRAPRDKLIAEIDASGLAGCGGGGFPTGRKWQAMPPRAARPGPRYFIVNADEMEPGTFKDRHLIEGDPHQLIEGIILAAYAVDAEIAYIFIRGEYAEPIRRLGRAAAQATAANLLGANILGRGIDLTLHIHTGAGRYICGEETALLNSLEGRRAIPRAKPPLPQTNGLFGAPTIVNNVETICNIPHIIRFGAAWYKKLGRDGEPGTRLFGVSGRVQNPGSFELPTGTPLRELIEIHAGGMRPGFSLRALLPGGASTGFLSPAQLDTPMSNAGLAAIGQRLGTGNVILLDSATCPIGFMANLQHFFAQESCGWCAPCRDGLPWVEQILRNFQNRQGTPRDLAILNEMVGNLAPGRTFCGLAPGAMASLQTGLSLFADEFSARMKQAA